MSLANTAFIAAIILAAPVAARAASVDLKNLYARVEVIPEDRSDIAVDMRDASGRRPTLTRFGDSVVIDGGRHWFSQCDAPGARDAATTITLRTPRDVHITANGAVTGQVGAARELSLIASGCGEWRIADVSDALSIHQSGAARIRSGAAKAADLELSGVSNIDMTTAGSLKVDMSGAGRVHLQAVSGPVDADLSGVGSVDIASGRAGHVRADVSGMGGFTFHGAASALDAEVSGIGHVSVDHVDGPVHKSVSGIGRVSVGS